MVLTSAIVLAVGFLLAWIAATVAVVIRLFETGDLILLWAALVLAPPALLAVVFVVVMAVCTAIGLRDGILRRLCAPNGAR